MSEYMTREDHKPYETAVVEEAQCEYCGASITQRAEGRRRKFCDATCRSGSHRNSKMRRSTKMGLKNTKRA